MMLNACMEPITYEYEEWTKGKASEIEIVKALLECGYPEAYPGSVYRKTKINPYEKIGEKERVVIHKCMKKAGFIFHEGTQNKSGYSSTIRILNKYPSYPSVIPSRDINKRLKSPYCKAYPNSRPCEP